MICYSLDKIMCQINSRSDAKERLIISSAEEADFALENADIECEYEHDMESICFNKVEIQNECLSGTLYIPDEENPANISCRMFFFINRHNFIILENGTTARQITEKIINQRYNVSMNLQRFICLFFSNIMACCSVKLTGYEKRIMELEELIFRGEDAEFLTEIFNIKKELLIFRSYYDELCDIGRELEQDEIGLFEKKQRKYFGAVYDKADRLMNKSSNLLEYTQQIRDIYLSQINSRQNKNMEVLTVISTIFFPLTLITSWYGMNFEGMPELKHGYPFIIGLSASVLIACIVFFKKKKML